VPVRIGVDDAALTGAADAIEHAAALLASVRLDSLATAVARAMPGSRSADEAVRLVDLADDVMRDLTGELGRHADALRTASTGYAGTESEVLTAARRAAGAA
jgi:hypothetical protein